MAIIDIARDCTCTRSTAKAKMTEGEEFRKEGEDREMKKDA
jgi:hypothetical protein